MLVLFSIYLDKDRVKPVLNNVPMARAIITACLDAEPVSIVSAVGTDEKYPSDSYWVVLPDGVIDPNFYGILDIYKPRVGRITASIDPE